jgi:Replication-relaxation
VKTLPNPSSLSRKEQEWPILLWLLHHPLQRIRDLAVGLDLTKSTIARALQELGSKCLVEQITPALGPDNRHGWYYLSSAGIHLIASREGTDPVLLARAFHADERHLLHLLPRLHQIAHLQDLVDSLVSSSPVALADADRSAEIRFGWQREYRVHFQRRHQVMRCAADAVVVLRPRAPTATELAQTQQPFFTLLVYLDLGQRYAITSHATMVRTLRSLLLYRESRERQPYRSMFPLVLIVVESAHQLELWQQAAQAAARQLRLGKPLASVIINLAKEVSGSLWNAAFRDLTTNAHCRLQERLVPMDAAAVPSGIIAPRVWPKNPDHKRSSRVSRIVEGQYQMRMEALLHEPHLEQARNFRQERERIALLSLKMSDRYRSLLLMLYTHPLLSIEELAVLSGLQPRTASRYVFQLAQWGCVERFQQPQGKGEGRNEECAGQGRKKEEVRWALATRGLLYISASTATPMRDLYRRAPGGKPAVPKEQTKPLQRLWQRGVGQLYQEWRHTAGVYSCVVAFHKAVQSRASHRIAWFETHFRCARHYQINKRWHNFRPDAVLSYVVKEETYTRRYHLWIEWDGGTMKSRALREKWHTYAIYMRSLEWRSRMSTGVHPLLLIIVPNRSQQDRVTRLVQEVFGETTALHVRITTQDLLHEHGPLGTIWMEVVPRPAKHQTRLRALLDLSMSASD